MKFRLRGINTSRTTNIVLVGSAFKVYYFKRYQNRIHIIYTRKMPCMLETINRMSLALGVL